MYKRQEEDYDKGIKYLQEKYQIPLILLTMGKDGSRAYYKGMRVERAGKSVKAIETTGAGDTFCGGLCVALSEGKNLKDAIIFASKASSISVTRMGAQVSIPLRKEIQ